VSVPHQVSLPQVSLPRCTTDEVPDALAAAGAALLPDAGVTTPAALAELAAALGRTPVEAPEPFAPRVDHGAGVWSQPAWPATSPMCHHHELGWQRHPPPYLLVACVRPATSGGRTGIADGREVLAQLPDDLVERATAHGWTLLRRYAPGLVGTRWQDAFGTDDPATVTAYAATEDITLSWSGPDQLTTRRDRPALRPTGPDGEPAWSNLLAFCSEWTLDPAVRDYLVMALGRDALPFETAFGDGTPFTAADVATVNAAYDRVGTGVEWAPGAVLVLDNVRVAHSMEPYEGDREMLVMHAG
jgi:hypothetical protein